MGVLAAAVISAVTMAAVPALADTGYVASLSGGGVSGFVGPIVKGVAYEDGLPSVALAQPRDLVVSPDGGTLYVITGDGLATVNTQSRVAGSPIAVGAGPGSRLALTPDGRTALVTSPAGNTVTPVDTATHVARAPIAVNAPTDVAVAPDGLTAYVITADTSLTPVDLATGTPGAPIALGHPAAALAITPDGALALVAEADELRAASPGPTSAQVVDLAAGTTEPPVALDGHGATAATLSPDGATAYIADAGTSVVPFGVAARTARTALKTCFPPAGVDQAATGLAVTADGRHLLGAIPGPGFCGGVFSFNFDAPPNPAPGGNVAGATTKSGVPSVGMPSAVALAPDPSVSFADAVPHPHDPLVHLLSALPSNAGGTVSTYAWSFGDGSPGVQTSGAQVGHTFPASGSYAVTLTTTNQDGCAAQVTFTGHGLACSGRQTAIATRTITIGPPAGGMMTIGPPAAAKLQVLRADVRGGRLDLRVQLTRRATGTLKLAYRAAGHVHRFTKRIPRATGSVENAFSFTETLPSPQRRTTTGIVDISYAGTAAVRSDDVRLRAASGKAHLKRTKSTIDQAGNLIVEGIISSRAIGVVRIRLAYADGGTLKFFSGQAPIKDGRWALKAELPQAAAASGGQASIQFTGLMRRHLRGEQISRHIAP